ncbi:MAG: hypothetical protein ACK6CU_06180 [Deltaproteobacteria bacterium]
MRRSPLLAITALAMLCLAPVSACGGNNQRRSTARRRAAPPTTPGERVDDRGRCETEGTDREVSEYDTSGDEIPDVRRVFRRAGDPPLIRLVLTCREADLNGDGTKDVVRHYNDEGRPIREEADRNFDGQIDTITFFQDGRIVRQEVDENADGRVDMKVFFDDNGQPLRAERDLAGRSTPTQWHPDRWEYFERGRMVRMGTDIDGDGRVDRWDRDHDRAPAPGEGPSALDGVEGEAEGAAPADG